jgi:transcriptional regulator with XRE-family HTH domain
MKEFSNENRMLSLHLPKHGKSLNGYKLRQLRNDRGLTLEDLSNETNIDKGLINKIENGRRSRTSLEIAVRFAEFFKVKIENLL